MSTDAEKVGAMVSAMHSALENNKELHREITALKAENEKLKSIAGFKSMTEEQLEQLVKAYEFNREALLEAYLKTKEKLALAESLLGKTVKPLEWWTRDYPNDGEYTGMSFQVLNEIKEFLAKIQGEKME